MYSLVESIKKRIENQFIDQEGSHDWQHILRVYNLAVKIQSKEGGDKEIIELAALLHDISDHKFKGGDATKGGLVAEQLILHLGGTKELAQQIHVIVNQISYKGAGVDDTTNSLEAKIIQDADRIDAIGAIGIARAFAYGGAKHRPLYDATIQPKLHQSFEDYKNSKSHTINHFYEKLLLLKDRLHTQTAKDLATERHLFMEQFLAQFFKEWEI